VAGMAIRFIDDIEENRIERLRQARDNSLPHDQVGHSRFAARDATYLI
jgi:hypothetical protein